MLLIHSVSVFFSDPFHVFITYAPPTNSVLSCNISNCCHYLFSSSSHSSPPIFMTILLCISSAVAILRFFHGILFFIHIFKCAQPVWSFASPNDLLLHSWPILPLHYVCSCLLCTGISSISVSLFPVSLYSFLYLSSLHPFELFPTTTPPVLRISLSLSVS